MDSTPNTGATTRLDLDNWTTPTEQLDTPAQIVGFVTDDRVFFPIVRLLVLALLLALCALAWRLGAGAAILAAVAVALAAERARG
jgi:hypothetical protein